MYRCLGNRLTPVLWLFLAISVAIIASSIGAFAATYSIPQTTGVKLTWDHNDPLPEGYRIYQRKSGQDYDYSSPVWAGAGNAGTVYNLDYDTTYHFVVRAYEGNLESTDSDEVSFMAPAPAPPTYSISATVSGPGKVFPDGVTTVDEGASQTYTITPDTGYYIADLIVDGVSEDPTTTYTFSAVDGDHTILARFEMIAVVGIDTGSDDTTDSFPVSSDGSATDAINNANGNVSIWIEAEDGDIAWPMVIADSDFASNGSYIWSTAEASNPDESRIDGVVVGGSVSYFFEIPEAGNYTIWGRQISIDYDHDSFIVSIDDGDEVVWHAQLSQDKDWVWDVVSERAENNTRDLSNPNVYQLDKGEHKISIKKLDDGTMLDKLCITNTHSIPDGALLNVVTAVASSVEHSGLDADKSSDGDTATRWASDCTDTEWIYLDLGGAYWISRVDLTWETAYGAQYEIQVSNNASEWTTVYTEYNGNGDRDEISFAPREARYVRMNGLKRGTVWGYSLYEFEVK